MSAVDLDQLRRSVVRGEVDPSELLAIVLDLDEYVVTSTGVFHVSDANGLPSCGVRAPYVRAWAALRWSWRVCRTCNDIREGRR